MTEQTIPNNEEITMKFEEMYEKTFGTKISDNTNVTTLNEEKEQYDENNKNNVGVSAEDDQQKEDTSTLNETTEPQTNISIFENEANYIEPVKYKFIGIVFTTYIILEVNNEMYMIDQHAAHEKVLYEKIKKNFYNNQEKDSQLMLLPDIINLTHKEMDLVMLNKEMFERAGFTMEEFGENTIKLTGVPEMCMDLDTKELFMNILDEIGTLSVTSKQAIEDKFIATIACKSAVKANMPLSYQEVETLMDELFKLENPFNCPHGRPTTIRMTKTDIEKKFKRIQ